MQLYGTASFSPLSTSLFGHFVFPRAAELQTSQYAIELRTDLEALISTAIPVESAWRGHI